MGLLYSAPTTLPSSPSSRPASGGASVGDPKGRQVVLFWPSYEEFFSAGGSDSLTFCLDLVPIQQIETTS